MNTYNNLVEKCFNECITSFRTKAVESDCFAAMVCNTFVLTFWLQALEGSEEQCVTRCVCISDGLPPPAK